MCLLGLLRVILIPFGLVALNVVVHAGGLALLLRALSKSHAAPPVRPWPITWLLIRTTWWLILIHLVEIAIWALFYLVMSTVRATAAWSLVGTLLRTVGAGIRSTWGGVSGVMSKSDESRAADVAARITRSVKEELCRDIRMDRVHGGTEAAAFVRKIDFAPSKVAFDAAFDKSNQ